MVTTPPKAPRRESAEEKKLREKKCQSIFLNLLTTGSEKFTDADAPAYIREFFQTARCDDVFDFSEERKSLQESINSKKAPGTAPDTALDTDLDTDPDKPPEKALLRILYYKEVEGDQRRANQAVIHYKTWHERRLLKALDWEHSGLYHFKYRWERTLAYFGLFAGGMSAGWAIAKKGMRKLQKAKPSDPPSAAPAKKDDPL